MNPFEDFDPELVVVLGVDTKMTILVHGELVLLHTSRDEQAVSGNAMIGGLGEIPGKPMECTHEQARALAHLILSIVPEPPAVPEGSDAR